MKPDGEPLHKRPERLRLEKGLTARAMAKLIGMPESTYREWEYGRGLKLPPFQRMSQVLAISVTELVVGQVPSFEEHCRELLEIEERLKESRLKLVSLL